MSQNSPKMAEKSDLNNSSDDASHDERNKSDSLAVINTNSDKILPNEGQCFIDGPDTASSNNDTCQMLVDFEQLIDSTRDCNEASTSQNIQEFENILSSYDTTELQNDEVINLDEISDIFDNLVTETISISSQEDLEPNNNENAVKNLNIIDNMSLNTHIDTTTIKKESHFEIELDTISISSEETKSSDDGYNSSDFEFITEEEAKMEGFIINFGRNNSSNSEFSSNTNSSYAHHSKEFSPSTRNDGSKEFDPGEGPSGIHRPIVDDSTRDYRQNHEIPQEEGYLDLFRGQYNPLLPLSDIIMLENKSIRPSAMNVQYEGIGFDMQLIVRRNRLDSSEEEYEDEARESVKKILRMYPGENRTKRRRRF
ncbi:uncharacterized protein LOC142984405 [Anticarsia gemmatalis]|uniref:uncharacterized protein LOC142984405 n=1 Tax=Anticarsia gemmatalis TaxID=129554 RepID=UPI003F76E56C